MEASRAQLQAIGERLTLAQAKIEKIKGSKKAIKVVTSVKAAWPPFFLPLSLFTPDVSSGEEQGLAATTATHSPLPASLLSRAVMRIPFLSQLVNGF